MVKKHEREQHGAWKTGKCYVKADVIILGCNLPGIVTAHKLKEKFGRSMDIMVLDLPKTSKSVSKQNVVFKIKDDCETEDALTNTHLNKPKLNTVARNFLIKYANEFDMPLPDALLNPKPVDQSLNKVFQYSNGSIVCCEDNYHNFSYLNFIERLELNQYQNLLDECVKELFLGKTSHSKSETKKLLYYDHTTMETHICKALLFATSRQVMRCIVKLVCGVTADSVSVLFYLHQCYRVSGCRNHIDGVNTRNREKLLGYFRKRIKTKLEKSVADITLLAKPIRLIRTHSDEEVILETIKGSPNYVCSLLALALRPDELKLIDLDDELFGNPKVDSYKSMIPGLAKKFVISYEDCFWRKNGYSGDIFSMQGPIIWATEKPKLSTVGSEEKYSALIGYLNVKEDFNSKKIVIAQLIKLFGEEAAIPVNYKETDVIDIFIPRCGDYVAMRNSNEQSDFRLEWGTLDIFADGDVASALEAGHKAYIKLLQSLRPQAQSYEDIRLTKDPVILEQFPIRRWLAGVNYKISIQTLILSSVAVIMAVQIMRSLNK